ncbi:hypothetical protein EL22_19975 [Halostagnicola sp. A56]|uniref:hypothetical protein n=1 Tax=Halostagnicola sp. A56 TaxID=1495067 RepID=UPI0004A14AE4|nr:hypothetical protein [Halostagnicola sp. A56]KDE59582.1 hypothetical protein EL22_19975 [Halostagnicola sp. A56]
MIACQHCGNEIPDRISFDETDLEDDEEIVKHSHPAEDGIGVVTDFYCNGSCAAEELDRRPIEKRLEAASEELRVRDNLGEATWFGDLGLHTFYNPSRTGYGIGMTTATAIAFQKTIEELWLEADIVEDNQGEVTPEAVAAEAENQLEEFIGQFRFFELYAENLEEVLRDAQQKYDGVSWS